MACGCPCSSFAAAEPRQFQALGFEVQLDVAAKLFDGERSFVHARAGAAPGAGRDGQPAVVMTMNTMHLAGSDVFKALYVARTDDLGKHWTEPKPSETMGARWENVDGKRLPVAASDFVPQWHAASGKLLGTGHTVVYTPDWKIKHRRPRHTVYSVYNTQGQHWEPWNRLVMPNSEKFYNCGAGSTSRWDQPDGTILLPMYFVPLGKNSRATVARCRFDGRAVAYIEHGDEIAIDDNTRGMHEPSLAWFEGQYFLTLRNDRRGYVTRGPDGLHFEKYRPWTFDDGTELGNYNTQQRWVVHSDGLFLVYTRRGANNDHVFRHRAPLFMGQVDPERLCVIRQTERILVPERGARLGNFGVTPVTPHETWVTVAELMQPRGVQKHGSDGSVFVARIRWSVPNRKV